MPQTAMPSGAYYSVIGNVRIAAGGQTRMALLRHRLFAEHTQVEMPIITYDPVPTYDLVRASLREDGLLLPESRIINMHEDLRIRQLDHLETVATPDVTGREQVDVDHGYAWRRRLIDPTGRELSWDYLRPDGSMYARTPPGDMVGSTAVFDRSERPVAALSGLGGLWRWWTKLIVPVDGPVVLISDSRYIAVELGELDDQRIVLIHQMHTPHVGGQGRWTSPVNASYRESLSRLGELDGLSTLTSGQRDDIARRFGATDNLVVIANPVEMPEVPEPLPVRVPGRIVMVSRLDNTQKRVDLAIHAFARLHDAHPDARLDIYGDGPDADTLSAQITSLGLDDVVSLKGHDARAADQFWTADLSWVTSAIEGFGLAILESRARGCPVISFDVPYGPAAQIEDEVDGVLVPSGDVERLASETSALLFDRPRLESMRRLVRSGAAAHGFADFLSDWADAIRDAMGRKAHRTSSQQLVIGDAVLALADDRLSLTARLDVDDNGDRDAIAARWQAYSGDSIEPIDLDVSLQLLPDEIAVVGSSPFEPLRALGPGNHRITTRLLVVWRNSAWQLDLAPGGLQVVVSDGSIRVARPRQPSLPRRIARKLFARR